jgi:hypothetical protein
LETTQQNIQDWLKLDGGGDPGFQLLTEEEETMAEVIKDSAMEEESVNELQEPIPFICFLIFFFFFFLQINFAFLNLIKFPQN